MALGQVVQLCIHFASALGLVLRNPMIFNGNRSYIHSEDTMELRQAPFKLYIPTTGAQNVGVLVQSLVLLEDNLMKIYRGLSHMKDRENIGFIAGSASDSEDLFFPNRIIRLLHKICEF